MYFLVNSCSDKFLTASNQKILEDYQITKTTNKNEVVGHYLFFDNNKLAIADASNTKINPISVDFESKQQLNRLKKDPRQSELLYKAIKGKKSVAHAIDGTAGMGIDSMIMARLGYSVVAYEKNPIVYLLLQNGLVRARKSDSITINQASHKIDLKYKDINLNKESADLLYLDFMFDHKDKKTKSKKNMELFKDIVKLSAVEDQNKHIDIAVSVGHSKVIIKRPVKTKIHKKNAYSHSILGKSIRFDIYLPNK